MSRGTARLPRHPALLHKRLLSGQVARNRGSLWVEAIPEQTGNFHPKIPPWIRAWSAYGETGTRNPRGGPKHGNANGRGPKLRDAGARRRALRSDRGYHDDRWKSQI